MRPIAIQIIRDEHAAIAAVLYTLRYLIKGIRENDQTPNFPLLKAILDYIVAYPDRWHHPKEDKYLFATLKQRTNAADALIDSLEKEHQQGYPMIEQLQQRLIAFQKQPQQTAEDFFQLALRYIELEWAHMRKEEDELLPLAEAHLSTEDWQKINQAFQENDNPLFGLKPKEDAERLYQKILNLAPAPIGYAR